MQNNQEIVINLFFLKFLGKYLMKVKHKYVFSIWLVITEYFFVKNAHLDYRK